MSPTALRSLALALAVGTAGGLLFLALGLPLAWMLGPMLATMLASLAGAPLAVPAGLRGPTIAILGVLLGSGFDHEVLGRLVRWAPVLIVLPLYVALVTAAAFLYLRRLAGLDPRSAWFSASPGGLGEMIVMGDRAGGDLRTIALVHSTRILLVVMVVPFALRALGYEVPAVPAAARAATAGRDLVLLAGCGVLGFVLGRLARLPAPALLGPMVVSAAAHLLGLVEGGPPTVLVAAAQLVIGAQVGARFSGYPMLRVAQAVASGLGLTALMLAAAVGFGWLLARLTGLSPLLSTLALAPGGLAEMSLLALALTDDPALVAAVHILRIALVVIAVPILFPLYERRLARRARS